MSYGQQTDVSSGGFERLPYLQQETAPGMILIEGGIVEFKNEGEPPAKKRIPSFYISAKEETNGQYRAYLSFIKKYYSPETYLKALPDTTIWEKESLVDSIKTYFISHYLRDPYFNDFPVVGAGPEQIEKYCIWKTDRLNEMILIREGILDFDSLGIDSVNHFSTEAYLGGKYEGMIKNLILKPDGTTRGVRMEDGIFLPSFRLPTVEEWELAALAMGDKDHTYLITPAQISNRKFDKKNYFGFLYVESGSKKSSKRKFMPSYPELNPVYEVETNNYLIYGFCGNVSEIIKDENNYFTIGGSWKDPGPDYASAYDVTISDSLKYKFPYEFNINKNKKSLVCSTTGFRLAMILVGGHPTANLKRRKIK